jgi:hypothetical protein
VSKRLRRDADPSVVRRALLLSLALVALAFGLAAAVSPISPAAALADLTAQSIKEGPTVRAPRSAPRARKILVKDVKKLAGDFAHKRYRSVCSDLTAQQRRKLGGTKACMLKVELLNSSASIKSFTVVKAKINKRRTRATISARINGSSKRVLKGTFKWEGRKYRLDRESGA